jgi:hypothetical protein
VIASIGGEHAAEGTDRFHNHQPGSGQYLYRWSSVQYRVVDGCASLWAIGTESTADLLHWVAKLPATLRVGQRMYPLGPLRIQREVHTLRLDTQSPPIPTAPIPAPQPAQPPRTHGKRLYDRTDVLAWRLTFFSIKNSSKFWEKCHTFGFIQPMQN